MNVLNAVIGVFKFLQRRSIKNHWKVFFARKWQSLHCVLEWPHWHALGDRGSGGRDIVEEATSIWARDHIIIQGIVRKEKK